jgi:aspartyl-tRNA(Asn)/glutamyl-tRNA(Gln) amidotransferase subunit B
MTEYEPVIGLEVHAQLKTESKIFCGCPTEFGGTPNDHVCPVCMGMPGVLPVLNQKVVEFGIRIGVALNCEVADFTRFDRKNYFYPDLPKDYQISQYKQPICSNGHLTVQGKKIRILRAHLEEDAGKLVHAGAAGLHGSDYSLVDYNRTGVPLMEIVSEPDIESAEMARDYLMELRRILRYIDVCYGDMEKGTFRCDANVSIRPKGDTKLGTKAELKNMNSFSAVQRAIEYEVKRQTEVLSNGGRIVQETRLWNEATRSTHPMRSKEEAHDYRYFPEPDLVPLLIDRKWVEEIRLSLPELPEARRRRYIEKNSLSADDAGTIAESRELSDFYDQALQLGTPAREAANWLVNEISRYLNEKQVEITATALTAENLRDLIAAIGDGRLNSTSAKTVLSELMQTQSSVDKVIAAKGLAQISDENELRQIVRQVLSANASQLAEYKAGKTKVRQFFFGETMKALKGKGNPAVINKLLDELLSAD